VALEGLDARITDVAVRRMGAAVPELPRGGGWIFAEVAGGSPGEAAARAREVIAGAQALSARTVTSQAEAAALWRIRENGAGLIVQADPVHPAHAGWEDAAVPPDRLGGYLRAFEELMAADGLHGAPYGHFGDGCVHVRVDFPLRAPGGRAAYREFITGAARLVAGLGGSMSGEHGDGRARGELLPLMYSPAALTAFAAVKSAFDPDGVLNPGVIVAPVPLDDGLRQVQARSLRHGLGFTYPDDGGDLTTAYAACMRSHGVTNFYFTKESNLPPDTPAINIAGWAVSAASVHQGSPTYKAASSACEDKMPGGPPAPMTEAQKEAALRQAACIRAHGFPTYPDPVFPAGGGVEQQPAPGIDEGSPQFQKAMQDCSK
jgi:FAD linked oxidases, C-terminal domain